MRQGPFSDSYVEPTIMSGIHAHSRHSVNASLQDKEKRCIASLESHFLPQLLLLSSAETKACSFVVSSRGRVSPAFLDSSLQETPAFSLVDRSPLGPK